MRRCYLVCYDICDPKRLRLVHKIMKGYGEPWQYSVFFCVLKEIDRIRLEGHLAHEVNFREDQIMILDLGPNEKGIREIVTVLGKPIAEPDKGMIVI